MIKFATAKHADTETSNLVEVNEFQEGQFSVTFFTQYSGAKYPEELQKKYQLILSKTDLNYLANILKQGN